MFLKKTGLSYSNKVNENQRLECENHLLCIEISKLRALLVQQEQNEILHNAISSYAEGSLRYEQSDFLFRLQNKAVPTQVVYRDPGSWSSSLWVNIGEETNRLLNRKAIAKNSPVVLGRAVVGAIDYVGQNQSRVRLITDMALKPSVRVHRGYTQNSYLIEHINPVLRHLASRSDLPLTAQEKNQLTTYLDKLQNKLKEEATTHCLAKGILQGAGTPLWRSLNHSLKGIGFNYDFSDEEGPARELTTGKPLDGESEMHVMMPIIQVNDLLVTTGIDGVFPPGLLVAEVTKILPLHEGAYTYEIEAIPIVKNLDTLQTLFILPSLGFMDENCNRQGDGSD